MRGVSSAQVALSARRRRIVTFIAIASVIATVVGLLYRSELVAVTPTQTDSYGGGPLGHRLFAETLIELDRFVAQNRGRRFDGTPNPMLFIEPKRVGRATGFEVELSDALEQRMDEGLPTLVVVPKWLLLPTAEELPLLSPDSVGPQMIADVVLSGAQIRMSESSGPQELHGTLGSFEVEVPRLQVFESLDTYDEVLLDGAYGAVVVRKANGLIVLSDPDLLHNYSFARGENANLMLALLAELGGEVDTVVIDEVFHGHGKRYEIGAALGEFPTVLLIAHLLLLLLLLFLVGTHRFGPALPPKTLGHGPSEAIAVSASVLADGQSAGALAAQYVAEIIMHTHQTMGLPSARSVAEMAAALDEAARRRGHGPAMQQLLARVDGLRATKKANAELWAIVKSTHAQRELLLARKVRSAKAAPDSGAVSPTDVPPRTTPPNTHKAA